MPVVYAGAAIRKDAGTIVACFSLPRLTASGDLKKELQIMTKEKLYGIYAELCRELGQSPITFRQFLTISIAAKRAEAETDFMRFVAVYGTDAGAKLINAVKGE